MSIYERMKNRAGGVRVDTRIDAPSGVRGGEELCGTVILQGGREPRHITVVEFQLIAEFLSKKNKEIVKERGVIYRYLLETSISIGPGEEKRIPFRFPIPAAAPLSLDSSALWLETLVNVEMEAAQSDRDAVHVHPHPIVQCFFDAVKLLGLRLEKVELLHVPKVNGDFPYVQEFEFKPRLPSALEELEVYFTANGNDKISFFIEIDRRAKGLSGLLEEAFDLDERHLKLTLARNQLGTPEQLADELTRMILPYLKS